MFAQVLREDTQVHGAPIEVAVVQEVARVEALLGRGQLDQTLLFCTATPLDVSVAPWEGVLTAGICTATSTFRFGRANVLSRKLPTSSTCSMHVRATHS